MDILFGHPDKMPSLIQRKDCAVFALSGLKQPVFHLFFAIDRRRMLPTSADLPGPIRPETHHAASHGRHGAQHVPLHCSGRQLAPCGGLVCLVRSPGFWVWESLSRGVHG